MSIILKTCCTPCRISLISRLLSSTAVLGTKKWRVERGLSINKNAEGILTDGPDFTYLDGRPTPLLHNQRDRMLKQREIATRIVQLSSELDFAKQRHQDMKQAEERERQNIISNRLKPKGEAMKRK